MPFKIKYGVLRSRPNHGLCQQKIIATTLITTHADVSKAQNSAITVSSK